MINSAIVLDQHAEFNMYSASALKQQYAVWHVVPLGYIPIPSPPVFALTQQIPML